MEKIWPQTISRGKDSTLGNPDPAKTAVDANVSHTLGMLRKSNTWCRKKFVYGLIDKIAALCEKISPPQVHYNKSEKKEPVAACSPIRRCKGREEGVEASYL